uniref:Uncharacterized protein n=1 Tax=Arundo donax TaxID=35708 RepID=A0A0A9GQP9_ARUDO
MITSILSIAWTSCYVRLPTPFKVQAASS